VLHGEYATRAKKNYKTAEGRAFLAGVRKFIKELDIEMKRPSDNARGHRIAAITNSLELAADRYDLFGERDRRRVSR
jgi:hypothetical protein